MRPARDSSGDAPVVRLYAAGDRFMVTVRPCPDDQPSLRQFPDYLTARAEARLLRFARGWELRDEVDPAARRKAEQAEEQRLAARRGG